MLKNYSLSVRNDSDYEYFKYNSLSQTVKPPIDKNDFPSVWNCSLRINFRLLKLMYFILNSVLCMKMSINNLVGPINSMSDCFTSSYLKMCIFVEFWELKSKISYKIL